MEQIRIIISGPPMTGKTCLIYALSLLISKKQGKERLSITPDIAMYASSTRTFLFKDRAYDLITVDECKTLKSIRRINNFMNGKSKCVIYVTQSPIDFSQVQGEFTLIRTI